MTVEIPEHFATILSAPVYGHLATVRPDDEVQLNPMWFEYDPDEQVIRFTHTTKRAKYRNLQQNPTMTLSALHPETPFKYVEVRGRLVDTVADPHGDFYVRLGRRYGDPETEAPADKADRVVLIMSVDKVAGN
ncbi:PPOX class F420-dependent oxidoreductase [Agromyces sp. SYSU K20354]|uniref:PPOX class F420-dependent oxidoreductase n=1 Tax=Agromyces cavernae TaxID=2898659 RepID=UPI001E4EFB6A|nr:PPOX class F420-dependent oxidoreductase [Agromyces cavernae]MCD2440954.1 PPOX class F420-dependent oxidoreductase [Agromyces cavernae]